ncbi:MAG: hypothetical protein IPJ77_01310 [Planctomycetes bacterium]|nr:hypothetical protein [Planctomycetota bacterium]
MTASTDSTSSFTGPGSTGNVLAALANVVVPGLGQLIQGRVLAAFLFFASSTLLMLCCGLGLVFYVWAIVDAARWRAPAG